MRKKFIALIALTMVILSTSAAFATAPNPNITIVNPVNENTLYSDNLLISVKITEPVTIKVHVSQVWKVVNGTNAAITLEEYQKSLSAEGKLQTEKSSVANMDPFTTTNNLSFYTKKIENVTPGLYTIDVNTLGTDGKVTNTNTNVVSMKAKEENPDTPASLEAPQSGTTQFLKVLLKSIFGN